MGVENMNGLYTDILEYAWYRDEVLEGTMRESPINSDDIPAELKKKR